MDKKHDELLEFLQSNKDKLEVFLSADEKAKEYRFRIKGKKKSRTIFMSEQLQFLMNEFCIENSLKIGDFVELAIIEHLNRNGKETELKKLIKKEVRDVAGEMLNRQPSKSQPKNEVDVDAVFADLLGFSTEKKG